MIWWQTLLIAAVPAAVAAAALLAQQLLSVHGAAATDARKFAYERGEHDREEILAAHRAALTRFGELEAVVRAAAVQVAAHRRQGRDFTSPVVAPADLMTAADDALSQVTLLCSRASARACTEYSLAISELALAFLDRDGTEVTIDQADTEVHRTREAYVMEARRDLTRDPVLTHSRR